MFARIMTDNFITLHYLKHSTLVSYTQNSDLALLKQLFSSWLQLSKRINFNIITHFLYIDTNCLIHIRMTIFIECME
jgi:hypothetical protein